MSALAGNTLLAALYVRFAWAHLSGATTGSWTLPDGAQQAPTFGVQLVKKTTAPEGVRYLFCGETSSDDAVYSLTLLLI